MRKSSGKPISMQLAVDCVNGQGVPVHIKGLIVLRQTGGAGRQAAARARAAEIVAERLRATVRDMTGVEMVRFRQRLIESTCAASGPELGRLGLGIDSFDPRSMDFPPDFARTLHAELAALLQRDAAAGGEAAGD